MKILSVIFAAVFVALLTGTAHAGLSGSGSGSYILQAQCGNGACEAGEDFTTCPQDCPVTCNNDGKCDFGETNSNCPDDCTIPTCGNGVCDSPTEDAANCPTDCSTGGGSISIDIQYEFVKNGIIPTIPPGGVCTNPRGCPNFTKTMPIKFNAKGTIRGIISEKCTEAKCFAKFRFDNDPETIMSWDPFFAVFTGERGSIDLLCNQYLSLVITMTSTNGGFGWAVDKVYVGCDERITLNPAERRLAVGEKNKLGFLLNVWNPMDTAKTYNIEIRPSPDQEFIAAWLRFECGSVAQCSVNNNVLTVTVPSVDSREMQVMLTSEASSRAGTYPVNFVDSGNRIQGKGTLLVFAEGLSEFQIWQIIVLVLGASVIFAILKI